MINDNDIKESRKLAKELLATLPDQERRVMEERMGLTGKKPKTREEVAKMFAISMTRFAQIEEMAIELFKHRNPTIHMRKMYLKTKAGKTFLLGELSDRERRIIQERLGVVGGMGRSREEVCKYFAISDERLLQVEEKAKKILSGDVEEPI